MTDLLAPLSPDQTFLLQTMTDQYGRSGQWPTWSYVQATLDLHRLDADALMHSLPRVGPQTNGYGLAWYNRLHHIAPDSRPALTVAAAYHVPELAAMIGQPFLNVLRALVDIKLNAPISPDQAAPVTYTRETIRRALPSISDLFMARMPDLLDFEPPTWGGSRSVSDGGGWTRELSREIVRYGDVTDLKSYVARVTELMPEPSFLGSGLIVNGGNVFYSPAPPQSAPVPTPAAPQPPAPVYVKESLIKELEDKNATSQWDLTKLIRLTRELNSNFATENPYACHGLLRSILDHVAPVFEKTTFEQVASNPLAAWTRTDKDYLRKLLDFKPQGHDALHRHIRKTPDLIDMHDVPSKTWLNAFLRLVIDAL
ncbi:hypothetical protein [Streptomyces murinus]|uniref:hypothetical protein n=1 Tax=Streptomyces murinus TaxID=33900 RepID=UPI003F44E1E7